MHFPFDLQIGIVTIPIHPVFEFAAFFFGYRFFMYLKNKKKFEPLAPQAELWIIVGMALGAFLGSRIVGALEHPDIISSLTNWLYILGGQTIAGGIAGGILGVEIAKKILGVKRRTGDLFVYPLTLGIMIGRVGCFLTGVKDGTVGLPSNLPWAFDQGDGIPRHPTSLYEIIFLGALWWLLKNIEKRGILKQGDLFSLFILGYAFFRLLVEFIKPRQELLLGLSSIQLVSLVLVVYYSIYLLGVYKRT